ncbi:hypothetical protein [Streptomyces sp. NPDC058678]|uniref:hypothetical protein n=1 Tax=Streptomyces sp. NPDC058678 TaxID=3346595 RepID=UPI003652FB0D
MTLWQPGMRITAARLNDFTPVALTSSPTAGTNFAVSTFAGRKAGGVTEWSVILTYSGATITAGSTGNIGDVTVCTLPADCRPGAETPGLFEVSGVTAGSVRFLTNGQCQITSMYPTSTLVAAQTVKFGAAFATG